MKKKIKHVSILILLIVCLSACCDSDTYEVTVTGVESRALVLQDNSFVEFNEQIPINREDFFIEVRFTETEMIVSNTLSKQNDSDITVLEGAVVPCEDQIVEFINQVESIRVDLIDVDSGNSSSDITDQLLVQGTQQSVADYVSEFGPGIGKFLIDLSQVSSIPGRISYSIEVTTDDGLVFTTTSGIIQFN
jgi:hypothetical protein